MADLTNVGQMITYNPQNVQGMVNFIWYAVIGVIILVIAVYVLLRVWRKLTYTFHVTFYKKVGETEIVFEDAAKQIKLEGNYMFHYNGLNKFSPVIDSKYMRIVQKKFLGLFPSSKLGFAAYIYGESIFPIEVHHNPGLMPINLDQFNYLQSRIKANMAKYQKQNTIMMLLPYLALGGVIMMFIVGMIFYTKHIETISMQILSAAKSQASEILQKSGQVQVIPPG